MREPFLVAGGALLFTFDLDSSEILSTFLQAVWETNLSVSVWRGGSFTLFNACARTHTHTVGSLNKD